MSFKYLGYLTRFSEWLYLHFPKPNVGIVLWVEPKVAYERKKETHSYPLSFYRIQTERYLKLAKKLGLPTVNTLGSITDTITKILNILFDDQSIRRTVITKAFQNKTFFEVFSKYPNSKFYASLINHLNERITKFQNTIKELHKIFLEAEIKEYLVFKDYGQYIWIGNDVDIILPPSEFDKLLRYLQEKSYNFKYNSNHNPPSLDLFIENGLPVDIHLKIGWRNTESIGFEELSKFKTMKQKFKVSYLGCLPSVDAYIFSLSHIFDKGFVTKLEHKIIADHLDDIVEINKRFHKLEFHQTYLKYANFIRRISHKEFPVFISPLLTIKSIWRLMSETEASTLQKISTTMTITAMQIFWRVRYKLKGGLPFEIKF